ncbi:MAG TPA: glycosyl hydrolase 108 family protein [Saprospiraceae bacterium]|nr:glycosyl hydrolase 108 family protein [Saprospiraceae bacterium]HMP13467.1 glycosyl hydrolase 108 family protein [Saprospiraceae bacterium]
MADFELAAARVLKLEGGYQNNPNDKGNYNSLNKNVGTNYGVSARLYESWIGRPPTVADMKAITLTLAKKIYRERFWNKIKGDQIRDQQLATLVFDGAINHGVHRGVSLLQEVLQVAVTGSMDNTTLQALNNQNAAKVYHAYRERRIKFYNAIVAKDPTQKVFLVGWLNRMASFNSYVVAAGSVGFLLIFGAIFLIYNLNRRDL